MSARKRAGGDVAEPVEARQLRDREHAVSAAHATVLRDARIPFGQRQAIASRMRLGPHGNAHVARALMQRSPVAEAVPATELPVENRVERELQPGGGGIAAVFEILRAANRAEAGNPALASTLQRGIENLDSLWIAQQLQAFGPESGWPPDLLAQLQQHRREAVVSEMASTAGQDAAWKQSQGRFTREHDPDHPTATTFAQWAEADSESAGPVLSPQTTLNCWEMILLAAYNAGIVSWKAIHDVYLAEPKTQNPNAWFKLLARRFTPGGTTAYPLGNPSGPKPAAGDIVLFDGTDHVALASGLADSQGCSKVLSFYPPKDEGHEDNGFGTVGRTRLVTIEWLAKQMDDPKMVVRFGTPLW
jgi:hypothetical protein